MRRSQSQSQKRKSRGSLDIRQLVHEAWFQKAVGKRRSEEIARIVEDYYKTYGEKNIKLDMNTAYQVGTHLLLYYTYNDGRKIRCIICNSEIKNDAFNILHHFTTMHGPVLERIIKKIVKH